MPKRKAADVEVTRKLKLTIAKIRRGDTGEVITERYTNHFNYFQIREAVQEKYGYTSSVLDLQQKELTLCMKLDDFVQLSFERESK